jgi:hypothetical protein
MSAGELPPLAGCWPETATVEMSAAKSAKMTPPLETKSVVVSSEINLPKFISMQKISFPNLFARSKRECSWLAVSLGWISK